MDYVLDTNIILLYLKDDATKDFIETTYGPFQPENKALISIVTVAEIKSLALRNNWGNKRLKIVEEYLNELVIIEISFQDLIEAYAEIEVYSQGKLKGRPLKMSSRNMGKNDLWIAATAYTANAKLLTTDKDFAHLDGEFFDVIIIERQKK